MVETVSLFKKKDWTASIVCSKGHCYHITDNDYKKYFNSETITCPFCNKEIDLWRNLKDLTGPKVRFGMHYTLLGCIETEASFMMVPHKIIELDLRSDIKDGKLLYIHYQSGPGGDHSLWPIEFNSAEPTFDILKSKITLVPFDHFNSNAGETEIDILFCYAPQNILNDLATEIMINAFDYYLRGNQKHMIISAQMAIEILQNEFFQKSLSAAKIKPNDLKKFLQDQATYYSQLFILLKWISAKKRFPYPNEIIISNMRKLTKSRNQIMHTGKIKSDWANQDYQDMLISAFLLYKYFKIINNNM